MRTPRDTERASTMGMAVIAVAIVSMIVLIVSVQTMSSMFTTKQKTEKSAGMAAADSGIEKIRIALQAGLADESDDYRLSGADLARFKPQQDGIEVLRSDPTGWGMSPQLVGTDEQFTVQETSAKSVGYWQVYNVIPPRYANNRASDVVYFVRAWATSAGADPVMTIKPRIFRVEFRPSLFSDYQFVSNAPFWVEGNISYRINGPIHSNDYDPDNAFRYLDDAWLTRAIRMTAPPTCTERARFSAARNGRVQVAGASCANAASVAQRDAREISLLGARSTLERIEARCGQNGVVCPAGRPNGHNIVRLNPSSVTVNNRTYPLVARVGGDDRWLTVLLPGDVEVSGSINSGADARINRVTIANRRTVGQGVPPNVFLTTATNGSTLVGSASDRDSVGIITEGNIVLPIRGQGGCLTEVRLAGIAAAGAFSIPPEWVTANAPPVDLTGRRCQQTLSVTGSIAANGQFVASISYPESSAVIGYGSVVMNYERRLYKVPPPYYPTTLPWAMTDVQDADNRCLVGTLADDPYCGGA